MSLANECSDKLSAKYKSDESTIASEWQAVYDANIADARNHVNIFNWLTENIGRDRAFCLKKGICLRDELNSSSASKWLSQNGLGVH